MLSSLRRLPFALTLFILITSVFGASRASFCKCTCGLAKTGNGTIIIPLSSAKSDQANPDDPPRGRTCDDCNRKFCLTFNNLPALADCLPENKGSEEQIFTTCFQRDSAKDQAVVYTFIFVTVGLLVYAGVQPYLEKRSQPGNGGRSSSYAAVPPAQEGLQ